MIVNKYRGVGTTSAAIPEEMEALVLSGRGFENLALRRVPVPEPGPDQLLARVDAVFACASDGKLIELGQNHSLMGGWDPGRWPIIIGHEGSVTVVKVGRNLAGRFKVGGTFAVQPAINTGPLNYRERYRDAGGMDKVAIGYTLGGLFAEFILIAEEVILTDSLIPFDRSRIPYFAAAFGEPLSCVYSAQNQIPHIDKQGPLAPRAARLGPKKGGVTLILGGGPMGILHADLAMVHKPRSIIISEPTTERRENAEQILRTKSQELGIELIITRPEDLAAVLEKTTRARGADDCIVALGEARVQEQSIGYLAKGGIASFFGGTKLGESLITVDTRRIHYDSISMIGTSGGDPSDVQAVMKMLEAREISPERYVRRVGGLDAALGLVKSIRAQEFFGKGLVYPHVRQALFPVDGWSFEQEDEFLERHVRI